MNRIFSRRTGRAPQAGDQVRQAAVEARRSLRRLETAGTRLAFTSAMETGKPAAVVDGLNDDATRAAMRNLMQRFSRSGGHADHP